MLKPRRHSKNIVGYYNRKKIIDVAESKLKLIIWFLNKKIKGIFAINNAGSD